MGRWRREEACGGENKKLRWTIKSCTDNNLWRKLLQIVLENLLQVQSQALTSVLLLGCRLLHLVVRKGKKGRKLKILQGKVQGQSNQGTLQKTSTPSQGTPELPLYLLSSYPLTNVLPVLYHPLLSLPLILWCLPNSTSTGGNPNIAPTPGPSPSSHPPCLPPSPSPP